jgi:hypothetical protein
MCTNPSVIIISVVYSGLHLIYFHKKCKISNVLTVDAIQKIVKTVFLPKHVQIAHGKNAVAGIIYTNGRKIISIDFYTIDFYTSPNIWSTFPKYPVYQGPFNGLPL